MASVTLQNVEKDYGALRILHGVDLEIADGEFVVLVGPSGCGKSTLLRMIAGLEEVSGGEIHIGERLVNAADAAHDLEPLHERNHRPPALRQFEHFVGDHPGDEKVALGLGALENIQVANVEQVKCTCRVADSGSHEFTPSGSG